MFNNGFAAGGLVGELLRSSESALSGSSSSPRLDAEVLLARALDCSRSALIARLRDECPAESARVLGSYIDRRLLGEPVAYILGEREFWGLSFVVTPDVLIPRPESELLVEEGVKVLRGVSSPSILDLGTGSGCLAISLAHEMTRRGARDVSCVAVDRSEAALAVARQNAERLGVSDFVRFCLSDWLSNRECFSPPYDLIVANPPYIDPSEKTPVELSFEPASALFAGDSGLRDVKEIFLGVFGGAEPMLAPEGVLLCEVGAGKRAALTEYLATSYQNLTVEFLGDDSSYDRFTVLKARWAA